MHHFESNGFQFNYNGDYSGEIHVIDDRGIEVERELRELVLVATGYSVTTPLVAAVRDFVAEAVRSASIRELEQAETDELLTMSASEIYTLVRK